MTSVVAFGVKVNLICAVSLGSIFRKALINRKGPLIFNKVLCNYLKFILIQRRIVLYNLLEWLYYLYFE
jgi:hypothetical protein